MMREFIEFLFWIPATVFCAGATIVATAAFVRLMWDLLKLLWLED